MLDGKDPVTKKGLPVENIRNNVRFPVHLSSYYMLNLSVASDFPYRRYVFLKTVDALGNNADNQLLLTRT